MWLVRLTMRFAAPLGARREALQHRGVVDLDGRDLQFVDIRAVVVLGIGHRRFERLEHELGALLRHEAQLRQGEAHLLATYHVGNQAAFLRRDVRVFEFGECLHG